MLLELKRLDLQRFAEGDENPEGNPEGDIKEPETKKFTQDEVNGMIAERMKREKENLKKQLDDMKNQYKETLKEELEKHDKFSKMSDQQRAEEQLKIEKEELERTLKAQKEELALYRKEARKSEVLSQYTKDNLPCPDEFSNIVELVANIDDDEQRLEVYNAVKKYANSIADKVKNEQYRKENPKTGKTSFNGDNPFISDNWTEINRLMREDKNKARDLWYKANKPQVWASYFE